MEIVKVEVLSLVVSDDARIHSIRTTKAGNKFKTELRKRALVYYCIY